MENFAYQRYFTEFIGISLIAKQVGDRDHEVLGMGSFGENKLYGKST
jgi:hypothetical protein